MLGFIALNPTYRANPVCDLDAEWMHQPHAPMFSPYVVDYGEGMHMDLSLPLESGQFIFRKPGRQSVPAILKARSGFKKGSDEIAQLAPLSGWRKICILPRLSMAKTISKRASLNVNSFSVVGLKAGISLWGGRVGVLILSWG